MKLFKFILPVSNSIFCLLFCCVPTLNYVNYLYSFGTKTLIPLDPYYYDLILLKLFRLTI